jgi:hypothetical protein
MKTWCLLFAVDLDHGALEIKSAVAQCTVGLNTKHEIHSITEADFSKPILCLGP